MIEVESDQLVNRNILLLLFGSSQDKPEANHVYQRSTFDKSNQWFKVNLTIARVVLPFFSLC